MNLLITEFTENYMEKMFYFCLKKTGNNNEAEDLTQDIALNIIAALSKGTVPVSFSAWVWQIARNRYSAWADAKHRKIMSVTGSDINDYELEDECTDILGGMIHSEQLSLLRRELAFISRDYRDIVVAYYIEDKSVREIADILSLSVETVKKRLQRSRKILKEGMDMAREFGVRSYKPENVRFAATGSQPSGLPWSAVNRSIPKNILLQASNNPSTVEELSMELGIALPYMEEEVKLLYKATLLEKTGDKYVTNFFILDKECQIDDYNVLREGSNERSRLIKEFIEDSLSEIRALGIAGEHISDNAIKWWLLPDILDECIETVVERSNVYEPPVRANGENWGFVGTEVVTIPERTVMGHNGCGNEKNMFWTYKYDDYGMWDQCGEAKYDWVMLLGDIIRNGRKVSSFAENENVVWENINGKYAHADETGRVIYDILVFKDDDMDKIHDIFLKHKNYEPLIKNCQAAYDRIEEIFKKYSHKVLHDNIGYNIRMEMYAIRMMAVHDLVEENYLELPKEPDKSSLGMHFILSEY